MAGLQHKALEIRRDIITMLVEAKSGHTGGPMGFADVATCLFFHELAYKPAEPKWPDRDMWFFSMGHVTPIHYSCLGEAGFYPLRDLMKFRKFDGQLQGHPSCLDTPGVEVSSGSLGQGLSIAFGTAYGSRMDGHPRRVYALCSDGEHQEGSTWEAIMAAGHYKLDNLCTIVDYNNIQIDGYVEDTMGIAPFAEKYRSFRWNAIEVDGHDLPAILDALRQARACKGKPTVILARTIMGYPISFMRNLYEWHGKPPTPEQGEKALAELGTTYAEWSSRLLSN
ncbi:MAG: transketolase [candidate division Zixibacteria bacterium]|nr:transketolase [candidate division Zixibacteria bacterium]